MSSDAHVTLYTTSWCSFCNNLKRHLRRTETPFAEIDIEEPGNEDAIEWVESVNEGNRIVPTVRFSDDTHATNPRASAVRAKLRELTGEE
ncbi:glutaredoxin domain-containing protein [Corynebacterium breve]|uniref:Glutaredoxin domain-containing protein n=1 Tax=Corynebacterium breve TaxID=3049799 RepID=A0ABY8VGC9_9CORY|nr:glutaredoxin domain-containing protein [Corynebacterium breve]WIM68367.1 glutaredoxin domain-containing protein [Corynebacterium breve]